MQFSTEEIRRFLEQDALLRQAVWSPVSQVAGYYPPEYVTDYFNAAFQRLRHSEDLVARMESVRESLLAAHYHLWRLETLENEVMELIKRGLENLPELDANQGLSGGNTRTLDFECQAMQLCLRRVLENLGRSVEKHLKIRSTGFATGYGPKLINRIDGKQPIETTAAIVAIIAGFSTANADLVREDSLRNPLVQDESVRLGTVNLGRTNMGGVRIAFGGETFKDHELAAGEEVPRGRAELLNSAASLTRDQLRRIEQHVFEVYSLLSDAGSANQRIA